jgi:hypothetical protein
MSDFPINVNASSKENVSNKSTNVNTDQASNTKYPSVKAVFDWATNLFVPTTRTINGLDLSANRTLTTVNIADSTNKRYVTDEVASQWTLHDVTAGSVTSGTSNTISKSIELPDFGSILKLEKITAIKTGTNAVFRMRVYLSEVDNNIGGTAILLATAATSNANNIYLPMERIIEDIGGNLKTIANNANQFSDMTQSASRLDVARLTGSPLYLIVAVQCDNASDSARFESAYLTNH